MQVTPCTLWEFKKKKPSVLVSQPDWPLWSDCMSFTQVEEKGDWNTGDPATSTPTARARAREKGEAALDVHWHWIISAKVFPCFAFQNYLFNPLLFPAQGAASRWWSAKKAPKCPWDQMCFYSCKWEYTAETEVTWEQKPWFLVCVTFWYKALKIIMLTKEWLCRCCICSSKFGPCQEELE